MEEREGFIKDSKAAFKGALNGIVGSIIYEYIILFVVLLIINVTVSKNNPGITGESLNLLVQAKYESFPYAGLIACLGSLVTLCVFFFIFKFSDIKDLFKKAVNSKTLKYGCLGFLCIIGFSLMYNTVVDVFFNLEKSNSTNQDNVVTLIENSPFLGFVLVVALAPIVEELSYRYCLFGGTCRWKKWIGYVVSALVFGGMHFISSLMEYGMGKELLLDLVYLPLYVFPGLVFCYIYDKTSNLGSSYLSHTFNNLFSFLGVVCLVV